MSVVAELHPGKGMSPLGRSCISSGCGSKSHKWQNRREQQIARREQRDEVSFQSAKVVGSKQKLRGGRVLLRLKAATLDLLEDFFGEHEFVYEPPIIDDVEARREHLQQQLDELRAQLCELWTTEEYDSLVDALDKVEHELYGLDAIPLYAA